MAVQLFLNDTEVIIDSSQEIRITRENPYITLSDSYTLDVSIPLGILQNRRFFGSIQRIDASKDYREFSCRLLSSNAVLMEGTAHIVQSTDRLVKVQLACGVSALKMSSEQEGLYIDQLVTESQGRGNIMTPYLDYGAMVGEHHIGYGAILQDNTNGQTVNLGSIAAYLTRAFPYVSECPRLIDIARLVATKLGYSIDLSYLPEACGSIYVISAIQGDIGKKLPHWTVKEFLTQFQNFFGCTFVRSGDRALRLAPLGSYADNPATELVPVSEFQADYSEDDEAEGVINSNVEFEMEGGDTEVVDGEVLGQAKYEDSFTDAGAMANAFIGDPAEVKMHKLYRLNGEIYIGWEIPAETEGGASSYELRRIAPFNPLVRFDGADSVQLKIAPAYMEENVECEIYDTHDLMISPYIYRCSLHLPSVANPYGLKMYYNPSGPAPGTEEEEKATLQQLVEGTESVVTGEEKSDIMNVAFIDGAMESVVATSDSFGGRQNTYQLHLAFTDYSFKKQLTNNRRRWSLSLNPLPGYDFYLGQLHSIPFRCSRKVKHVIKFVSPVIPEATDIFIIQGKQFACEKIEASIKDGTLDQLMTGYFYEFL